MSDDIMADTFLYLTTTGRKSGKPRQIEIWFVEHRGRYYMVSEGRERSHWVRNILVDANVAFSIGNRRDRTASRPETAATGRIVIGVEDAELSRTVSALMDDKYGWSDGLIVELAPCVEDRRVCG